MALKLTTNNGTEIEMVHMGSPGVEKIMRIKQPDQRTKHIGKADEIIPGKELGLSLSLMEIDELCFMLRE
jgi:hypothetical protein